MLTLVDRLTDSSLRSACLFQRRTEKPTNAHQGGASPASSHEEPQLADDGLPFAL
jgi:hypothetical protein